MITHVKDIFFEIPRCFTEEIVCNDSAVIRRLELQDEVSFDI